MVKNVETVRQILSSPSRSVATCATPEDVKLRKIFERERCRKYLAARQKGSEVTDEMINFAVVLDGKSLL